jgi:hypothetical protein
VPGEPGVGVFTLRGKVFRMTDRMVWYTSSMGLVEIRIPEEAIRDIHQPGDAEEAVRYWMDEVEWFGTTIEDIRRELREYGAWDDDELDDEDMCWVRMLWLAACDLGDTDEDEWDTSEPVRA